MTERTLAEFRCQPRGHLIARTYVDERGHRHFQLIRSMVADVGRPGTYTLRHDMGGHDIDLDGDDAFRLDARTAMCQCNLTFHLIPAALLRQSGKVLLAPDALD